MDSKLVQTFLDSAKEGNIDELNTLLMQHAELINALDYREKCDNPFIRKGATAVIYAARAGKIECLTTLIKRNADLNVQDIPFGLTALMRAALEGQDMCLNALITAGAEKEIKNANGYSALLWAAREGKDGCLKTLLDAGAAKDVQNTYGNTALILAAYNGHDHCVQSLLNAGAIKDTQDNNGETALMKKANDPQPESIPEQPTDTQRHPKRTEVRMGAIVQWAAPALFDEEKLLGKIASYSGSGSFFVYWDCGRTTHVSREDVWFVSSGKVFCPVCEDSLTAYHNSRKWECAYCQGIIGANTVYHCCNKCTHRTCPSCFPYMKTKIAHKSTIIAAQNSGPYIDFMDHSGETALMKAAFKGSNDCLKTLLDANASVDLQDRDGLTAFMKAAVKGNDICLKTLLDASANVDLQDNEGLTVLMKAASVGRVSTCALLIKFGALVSFKNSDEKTALLLAKKGASFNAARLLLEKDDTIDDNEKERQLCQLEQGCFGDLYVCKKEDFLCLGRLITFEEAIVKKYIVLYPGKGVILFCSHRWLAGQEKPPHPDNLQNIKYLAVKRALETDPSFLHVEYVWIDFTCFPQKDPDLQQLAINSLPYFVKQCTHFLVLKGESSMLNEHTGKDEASIEVYKSRGWCRLECITAFGVESLKRWTCNINTGKVELFDLATVEDINPFLGNFCDMEDRRKIAATVFALCCRPEYSKIKAVAFKYLRLDAQKVLRANPESGCSDFEEAEMTHFELLKEHIKAARSFN